MRNATKMKYLFVKNVDFFGKVTKRPKITGQIEQYTVYCEYSQSLY